MLEAEAALNDVEGTKRSDFLPHSYEGKNSCITVVSISEDATVITNDGLVTTQVGAKKINK